jgi:hypothetical protein
MKESAIYKSLIDKDQLVSLDASVLTGMVSFFKKKRCLI